MVSCRPGFGGTAYKGDAMLEDFRKFLLQTNALALAVGVIITRSCHECLETIPQAARRCRMCGSPVPA